MSVNGVGATGQPTAGYDAREAYRLIQDARQLLFVGKAEISIDEEGYSRIEVEREFSVEKHSYGLGLITTKLEETQ